ncbi:hypothetical protein [Shinella sp. G-2]|uniref:hypothetical protein n=1 Tax=Shinella sp. G-2 TaxID=3133141 RepID=UPI003CFE00C5
MQQKTEWLELESLLGGACATFDTLASYLQLGGKCKTCRHIVPIDRHALARRFGRDRPLAGLEPKLKCTACDRRGDSVFVVAKLPR